MPNQPPRQNQNNRHGQDRNQPSTNQRFNISSLVDNEGNVLPNLISDSGQNNVKDLAEFLSKDEGMTKAVTSNQLRKFYDNFLKIFFSKLPIDAKRVQLIMMKAQLEYAEKRLKIRNFTILMNSRLQLVISSDNEKFDKNLTAMKLHFESIVGYFPKK